MKILSVSTGANRFILHTNAIIFNHHLPLNAPVSLTDGGQFPKIEPMNDHGALPTPLGPRCLAPLPPRSRLSRFFPARFFWGTFFLALLLVSGILPEQHSPTARMTSGPIAPLPPSLPALSGSPSPGLPEAFAGASEAAFSGSWGLAASFVETSSPDQDYSDLFCLHGDAGPGPVLECHHDDPPLSAPGIAPPFLAALPTLPLALLLPIPHLTGSTKKVPSPTLSVPALPPRGLPV